jgi:hypothetical protein
MKNEDFIYGPWPWRKWLKRYTISERPWFDRVVRLMIDKDRTTNLWHLQARESDEALNEFGGVGGFHKILYDDTLSPRSWTLAEVKGWLEEWWLERMLQ